ncbi:uncharacterized protein [Nicotiana sylvestris]|uniref:uncharacterized protein n=1 Tax=Nicotiana sylvestris TaxID=4096 RepID=UPI00388C61CF
MMTCKVVVGGEQIKKINEKLKAGREKEPQKYDESFKSATEGEETVPSKTEQVTSGPKFTPQIISEVATNLETRFVLVGTVAGVETTESGRVGGKNKKRKEKESEGAQSTMRGMEKGAVDSSPTPVGLTKESGAMVVWGEESAGEKESVREIGGNRSGEAAEGANKKRKAASSIPVEIPPTRERATRSQKKQSEVELEKALEESKRKVVAKGKKKVVEPIEAIEIDEMDLVLRDEDETKEVEVVAPKYKKAKTSTKKFVSKTQSAEPSTLDKRTRSDVKSRKVKIVEEEEWSGEEE